MRGEPARTVRLSGHEVPITHPQKVLFPDHGITKADLVRYYRRVARWITPYLQDRPLAMQRFPDGIGRPGFFQKAAGRSYPGWIRKVTVKKKGGTVRHVICDNAATLVYLANQDCITLHPWLSRADRLHFPDQMIFDLDPASEDTAAVVEAAYSLKDVLDEMRLPAYVKSTGSRGLHVAVPLDRKHDFDSVREFARKLAEIVVARAPARYTLEQRKRKRRGRVFFDVNRNAYAQTAVAVYAVRARPGAPVSAPLQWGELRKKSFRPDGVTIENVFKRLDTVRDPWKNFWRHATSLDKARRKLEQARAT